MTRRVKKDKKISIFFLLFLSLSVSIYCTPQSGIWRVISRVMRLYFHEPKASENIAFE